MSCAETFIEDDGLCHPSMTKCPAGTFAVPLQGCVPIDGPDGCGTGTWGNIPDGPDTMWVDPSYGGPTSSGTQQQPFTTIADALAAASTNGRIALAAGDYDEPVTIDRPLELVGRCPSMVTIRGTQVSSYGPMPLVVLFDQVSGARLSGVRLTGDGTAVVAILGSVEIVGVHVDGATMHGLLAAAGTVHIERSLIEGTAADPGGGAFGHGVEMQQGAQLTLVSSALVGNRTAALRVMSADTTVEVTDCLVADTLPRQDDQHLGVGVEVELGASLTLHSSALVGNRTAGLSAASEGTTVDVTDSLIAGTRFQLSDLWLGNGVWLQDGASLTIDSSALVDNQGIALSIGNVGTTAVVTESLLARTLPREADLSGGSGVEVVWGASLTLDSSAVVDNRDRGILAYHPGTTVLVSGSLVAGTMPREKDLRLGFGIAAHAGASVTVDSSAVLDNHREAVRVMAKEDSPEATLHVIHSLLADTRPDQGDGAEGVGVIITGRAHLVMQGSVVRRNHAAGILVGSIGLPVSAEVSGSLVDEVLPGKFHQYDEVGTILATFEDIGDGLVVVGSVDVAVADTVVRGASRAGLIFESAAGTLIRTSSTDCRFGLVTQGEPKPDYSDPGNVFAGYEKNILTDGALPVPQAPPMPSEPEP